MGIFGRAVPNLEESAVDKAGQPYTGDPKAIAFRDGFHYVVAFDPDGNELGPDLNQKLVWRDGGYLHARPEDPNHFHVYGLNAAEIVPEA